jgi:hypothetical protein
MIHAMTHNHGDPTAARSLHSLIPKTRPAASLHVATARLLRENGERYTTDPVGDEDDAASPSLSDAASVHTLHAREAQALLDDAVNLVGLLLDAVEQDGDTRAEQARTVLGMAVECLHGAHRAIDEQESRDHELYLAYARLKAAMEEEDRPPMDDFSESGAEDSGDN